MYKFYNLASKNIGSGSEELDDFGSYRNLTPADIDRLLALETSLRLAKICEPLSFTTAEMLLVTLS